MIVARETRKMSTASLILFGSSFSTCCLPSLTYWTTCCRATSQIGGVFFFSMFLRGQGLYIFSTPFFPHPWHLQHMRWTKFNRRYSLCLHYFYFHFFFTLATLTSDNKIQGDWNEKMHALLIEYERHQQQFKEMNLNIVPSTSNFESLHFVFFLVD